MSTKRELRDKEESTVRLMPFIPLRELAIFPQTVAPVQIAREQSRKAIELSQQSHGQVLLLLEPDNAPEEIDPKIFPETGVIARVLQVMALPNGTVRVTVEGEMRAEVIGYQQTDGCWQAHVRPVIAKESEGIETDAAKRFVLELFRRYLDLQRQPSDKLVEMATTLTEGFQTADFIAAQIQCPALKKQPVIASRTSQEALIALATLLTSESELVSIEKQIEGQVRDRINKSQRQYFLQEQLRQIKRELGEGEDADDFGDVIEFRKRIKKAKMPKEVRIKADEELERLKQMPMMSPEATVVRSFLDWLIALPWAVKTTDRADIIEAERILDEDHFGLAKPKERILEYLSVINLVGKVRGPILCFVGPPGVGKTSLGRSIARALDRKFVRVSLGGVRDEAEIRGHRRTYIGSLPGRIIQGLKKAGSRNPVFLLDEIDKMAVDFRGDPASALLEVLDPEQNKTFSDHYLEVEFDLSEVLFITTANTQSQIPEALLDRMEIIPLLGYLPPEKLEIAKRFLIPRQLAEHGLKDNKLTISDGAVDRVIEEYTRESGVRELERSIATLCRKTARKIAEHKAEQIHVTPALLPKLLGVPKFVEKPLDGKDRVGVAIGLAWTPVGGDMLKFQVVTTPGKGKMILTGRLGEVMKESGMAALSLLKSRHKELGIPWEPFEKSDLHVHVPEGAVPKDGPSAGITLATALYSALTGRKVRGDLAMTGELTLQGEVLPIGGLPEKLMAAKRAGISRVLIPIGNVKDLKEVPKAVTKGLTLVPVKTVDEVWKLALRKATKQTAASAPKFAPPVEPTKKRYTSVVPDLAPGLDIDLDDIDFGDI